MQTDDEKDRGLSTSRYVARYGNDEVITEDFMASVMEGMARCYVNNQRPPFSFQELAMSTYAASDRTCARALNNMNVWHACMRLRDFRGLMSWDRGDARFRSVTLRLNADGLAAAGISREGIQASYVQNIGDL